MDHSKEQLVSFLTTAQAHMTFIEAVEDFPLDRINDFPTNVEYTSWMLLEHIRRTQKDILDFMIDPNYKEPKWPDDYWPKKEEKADEKIWNETISGFKSNLEKIVDLINDPATDLTKKVEKGTGQTIMREILLIIDHNSYHIGEFAVLRQIMGTWPKSHK